jgi:uncharacterized protein YndB with AHSA1/START domain
MVFNHEYDVRISAPRAVVFERLLRIEHLARWFCGWARIEAKVGGSFKFGGETSIFLPEGRAWDTTIEEGEVLRRFAFTWPIRGAATRVAYDLEDAGDAACVVRTRHVSVPVAETTCGSVQDAWRVCLGNLKAISEGRGDSLRPDHEDVRAPEVRLACLIEASASRVFAALTEPSQVAAWSPTPAPSPADAERRAAGGHPLGGPEGEVLEIERDRRLVVGPPRGRHGLVRAFDLEPKASGTAVYLHETGFAPDDRARVVRHRGSWSDRLVGLRNFIESGEVGFGNDYDAQVREA